MKFYPYESTRRHPMIALQLRFSAAIEEMNRAWVIYRADRNDQDALRFYVVRLKRCQRLKEAFLTYAALRRENGRAA